MNAPNPLGLVASRTTLEIWLIGIVAALLAVVAFGFYERYEGAKNCKAEVRTERAEALVKNVKVEASGAALGVKADETFKAEIAKPVAPVGSSAGRFLRAESACAVPAAPDVPAKAAADLRTASALSSLQADTDQFIGECVQIGRNADAEINYWREQLAIAHAVAATCAGKSAT
jgi:hypothetical protein